MGRVRSRSGALVAVVALSVSALAVFAGSAGAAKGGNSANAKLCQKGGWETLMSGDYYTPFENQDECVSYAAEGGTFGTFPGPCIRSTIPFNPDMRVIGPLNTLNNLNLYFNLTNGVPCEGAIGEVGIVVTAPDEDTAAGMCADFGRQYGGVFVNGGYPVPSDWYFCRGG